MEEEKLKKKLKIFLLDFRKKKKKIILKNWKEIEEYRKNRKIKKPK